MNGPEIMHEKYMTVLQAARTLRLSTQTVRDWCNSGKLRFERVANIRLISREDVETEAFQKSIYVTVTEQP